MGSKTRKIMVRDLVIGGGMPISVQTMCATRTRDVEATIGQINALEKAGADLVRVAVDDSADVEALKKIRKSVKARLVVDLQENFRLAEVVAPFVDKIRYNPGHLHRLEKRMTIEDKVTYLAGIAKANNLALRVGVNCGSIAPGFLEKFKDDRLGAIVGCAVWHSDLLDRLGFTHYTVSLKDSDPDTVVACNKEFSRQRPDVPLHLGVTEAGLVPEGVIKTQLAFQQLIPLGIGDTIRVSLTLPSDEKAQEIRWGRQILKDIAEGHIVSNPHFTEGLNIISCPSCSRVENEDFVKLAREVKAMTSYASKHKLTLAVMGCRVNGPGETDEADLGLWCGAGAVILKRKSKKIGTFKYDRILSALKVELDKLIAKASH